MAVLGHQKLWKLRVACWKCRWKTDPGPTISLRAVRVIRDHQEAVSERPSRSARRGGVWFGSVIATCEWVRGFQQILKPRKERMQITRWASRRCLPFYREPLINARRLSVLGILQPADSATAICSLEQLGSLRQVRDFIRCKLSSLIIISGQRVSHDLW